LELHKRWLTEGKRPDEECRFAFARLSSNKFYDAMNCRLYSLGYSIPEPRKEIKLKGEEERFDKVPREIKRRIKKEVHKEIKEQDKRSKEYINRINKWQRKNKNYRLFH
jgi:tRNA pseudouridine-54 N-methylase